MANTRIEKNPVIVIGPYTTKVPFNYSLYCAEHTLTSYDVLEPVIGLGTPKEFRPIVGAKVMYRLIGDGTHFPSFSPLFNKTFDSFNFNFELGAINLIVFEFDGVQFRYSITPNILGYEFPRQVGNFDLGDSLMVVVGHSPLTTIIRDELPAPYARLSAYNVIKSIHYTGTNPIIYSLSKDGVTWVEGIDPKNVQLEFSCAEVSTQSVYLKVGDGVIEADYVILVNDVIDPELFCAP